MVQFVASGRRASSRHEDHREHRGGQHSPEHSRANGSLAGGAGPTRDGERNHAQREGQRRHENGTVRVSLLHYDTLAEVDRLMASLDALP
jgi:selenocysteine lyase/cysteine desulfurase